MLDRSVGFDPMLEQKEDKKENPYKENDIEFANDLINVLFDILSGALQQVCFPFIRSFVSYLMNTLVSDCRCTFHASSLSACSASRGSVMWWNLCSGTVRPLRHSYLAQSRRALPSQLMLVCPLLPQAQLMIMSLLLIWFLIISPRLVLPRSSLARPVCDWDKRSFLDSETIAEAVTPIPMFTKSGVTPPIDDDGEEGETDIDVKQLPTIEWLYYTIYPRTNSQSFSQLSDTPNDMLVQLIDWRRVESIVYKKHPETQERYNQLPGIWSPLAMNV